MQKLIDPYRIEKRRTIYAKKRDKKNFVLLYHKKYPSIRNLNSGKFWDEINFSKINFLRNSPIFRHKINTIHKLLDSNSGKLLDIGFGYGVIEELLSNANFKLFGIDISEKSVRNLQSKVTGYFKKGNILEIPYKKEYFDIVLCLDILEHISPKDTFKALNEIRRVLKHNGKLILSIPLNEGLEEMIKKNNENPNAHVRVYTPEIIKMELEIVNLEVLKEIYLTAFQKYYLFKNFLNKIFKLRKPNLLIIVAQKK